jgi:hypothetical protein
MLRRFGIIFFLTGFLAFSFSSTICALGKMNSQQAAELMGNMAEEEDETAKEDGSDSEEVLLQMFENVSAAHVQLELTYLSHPVDQLPDINATIYTPPPQA